jgi:hypothetical protein
MPKVFKNKNEKILLFSFIKHGKVLILEEGKLRSRKRELVLPFMVNMTSLKGIDKIKIIEKGIHPRVE